MTFCRNTHYIASAGTGKTHQVVNLYLSLLLGRPYPATDEALPGTGKGEIFDGRSRIAPERILMLTFSRNAAAEMRTRITEAIEKEVATGNPTDEFFYWSLLRRLPASVISTIHAFAQQLLGRHALRMGLAPHLTVIEGYASTELLNEAIATALRTALTGTDADYTRDVEVLCDGRKVSGIIEAVAATLRLCASWGIDLASIPPAQLIEKPHPPTLLDLQELQKKVEAGEWIGTKALLAMSSELRKTCRRLAADTDPSAISAAAAGLKTLMGSTTWGKEGKPLREEVKDTLTQLAAYPDQLEATRLLTSFLTLTREALRVSQTRKHEQGALDFDDLLFKARDLVSANPGSIPAVDVIIIDEAQDNSRLQNEFISLIQAATGASVVVCGDIKQTIYGWRGADPDGMGRFARTLKLHPVPLKVSYRSQAGILEWVNNIFARVMGPESYDANAELAPCPAASGTREPAVELLLPDWESLPRPDDWIQVPATTKKEAGTRTAVRRFNLNKKDLAALATEAPENWAAAVEQAGQSSLLEARALARRIRLLASPAGSPSWRPTRIWDSSAQKWIPSATGKSYRYRDILILLRTGTRQEEFEQALQEEGIPYTTDGKGRGFFTRQEVFDISHLLQWLAFPHDDNALVALLRSPLIGLTDSAIAMISKQAEVPLPTLTRNPRNGRWLTVLAPDLAATITQTLIPAGLATDAATWERSIPILNRLRNLAGRIHSVDLIRETVRLTGYDAILAGTFHGVQRLANLRKLLSWVQETERCGNLDLQSLSLELSRQIQSGQQAPDAAVLDPDDDSVRINTVHAAKGLSSPVVIIPDLQRASPNDRDWILVARDSQGAARSLVGQVKVSLDDGTDPETISGASFDHCSDARKLDRETELKRVFYVACTRPRDLLILSGANPSVNEDKVWRGWINSHLEACALNPALVLFRPYSSITQAWRALPGAAPIAQSPLAPEQVRSLLLANPGISPAARFRLPVTTLIRHLRETGHPRAHLEARLELASIEVAPSAEDSQEAGRKAYSGSLAHRVLELIDHGSTIPLQDQARRVPEILTLEPAEQQKLCAQLEGVMKLLGAKLKGVDPRDIIRELPFATRFANDQVELIVDGKVDLIFLKDGLWHIVDYKFSDHDAATLRRDYALQLAVYREALSVADAGGTRKPRFMTTEKNAAPFKLLLIGINSQGTCTEVDVSNVEHANLEEQLIEAAMELAEFP